MLVAFNNQAFADIEFFTHRDPRNNTLKCSTSYTKHLYRPYSSGKLGDIFAVSPRNILLKSKVGLLLSVEIFTLESIRSFDPSVTQWKWEFSWFVSDYSEGVIQILQVSLQ
jgi:hypothetical protein